jgi:hypothetical protein
MNARLRIVAALVTGSASVAFLLAVAAAGTSARPLLHVKARIRVYYSPESPSLSEFAQRKVTFSPPTIGVGTVIIDITNSDDDIHSFEINGVQSKRLGKGGRTLLRVTFKHPGRYPVALTSNDPIIVSGVLKVIK